MSMRDLSELGIAVPIIFHVKHAGNGIVSNE